MASDLSIQVHANRVRERLARHVWLDSLLTVRVTQTSSLCGYETRRSSVCWFKHVVLDTVASYCRQKSHVSCGHGSTLVCVCLCVGCLYLQSVLEHDCSRLFTWEHHRNCLCWQPGLQFCSQRLLNPVSPCGIYFCVVTPGADPAGLCFCLFCVSICFCACVYFYFLCEKMYGHSFEEDVLSFMDFLRFKMVKLSRHFCQPLFRQKKK